MDSSKASRRATKFVNLLAERIHGENPFIQAHVLERSLKEAVFELPDGEMRDILSDNWTTFSKQFFDKFKELQASPFVQNASFNLFHRHGLDDLLRDINAKSAAEKAPLSLCSIQAPFISEAIVQTFAANSFTSVDPTEPDFFPKLRAFLTLGLGGSSLEEVQSNCAIFVGIVNLLLEKYYSEKTDFANGPKNLLSALLDFLKLLRSRTSALHQEKSAPRPMFALISRACAAVLSLAIRFADAPGVQLTAERARTLVVFELGGVEYIRHMLLRHNDLFIHDPKVPACVTALGPLYKSAFDRATFPKEWISFEHPEHYVRLINSIRLAHRILAPTDRVFASSLLVLAKDAPCPGGLRQWIKQACHKRGVKFEVFEKVAGSRSSPAFTDALLSSQVSDDSIHKLIRVQQATLKPFVPPEPTPRPAEDDQSMSEPASASPAESAAAPTAATTTESFGAETDDHNHTELFFEIDTKGSHDGPNFSAFAATHLPAVDTVAAVDSLLLSGRGNRSISSVLIDRELGTSSGKESAISRTIASQVDELADRLEEISSESEGEESDLDMEGESENEIENDEDHMSAESEEEEVVPAKKPKKVIRQPRLVKLSNAKRQQREDLRMPAMFSATVTEMSLEELEKEREAAQRERQMEQEESESENENENEVVDSESSEDNEEEKMMEEIEQSKAPQLEEEPAQSPSENEEEEESGDNAQVEILAPSTPSVKTAVAAPTPAKSAKKEQPKVVQEVPQEVSEQEETPEIESPVSVESHEVVETPMIEEKEAQQPAPEPEPVSVPTETKTPNKRKSMAVEQPKTPAPAAAEEKSVVPKTPATAKKDKTAAVPTSALQTPKQPPVSAKKVAKTPKQSTEEVVVAAAVKTPARVPEKEISKPTPKAPASTKKAQLAPSTPAPAPQPQEDTTATVVPVEPITPKPAKKEQKDVLASAKKTPASKATKTPLKETVVTEEEVKEQTQPANNDEAESAQTVVPATPAASRRKSTKLATPAPPTKPSVEEEHSTQPEAATTEIQEEVIAAPAPAVEPTPKRKAKTTAEEPKTPAPEQPSEPAPKTPAPASTRKKQKAAETPKPAVAADITGDKMVEEKVPSTTPARIQALPIMLAPQPSEPEVQPTSTISEETSTPAMETQQPETETETAQPVPASSRKRSRKSTVAEVEPEEQSQTTVHTPAPKKGRKSVAPQVEEPQATVTEDVAVAPVQQDRQPQIEVDLNEVPSSQSLPSVSLVAPEEPRSAETSPAIEQVSIQIRSDTPIEEQGSVVSRSETTSPVMSSEAPTPILTMTEAPATAVKPRRTRKTEADKLLESLNPQERAMFSETATAVVTNSLKTPSRRTRGNTSVEASPELGLGKRLRGDTEQESEALPSPKAQKSEATMEDADFSDASQTTGCATRSTRKKAPAATPARARRGAAAAEAEEPSIDDVERVLDSALIAVPATPAGRTTRSRAAASTVKKPAKAQDDSDREESSHDDEAPSTVRRTRKTAAKTTEESEAPATGRQLRPRKPASKH